MFGGLFVNRAQAFKYALFENGHHSEAVNETSHEIELDVPTNPQLAGEARRLTSRRTVVLCGASTRKDPHALTQSRVVIVRKENLEVGMSITLLGISSPSLNH